MPTTGVNFLITSKQVLAGSAVTPAPAILPLNPQAAAESVAGGGGVLADKTTFDASADGYAKHACASLTLTGTTAISLDLTALAAATGVVVGGDSSFANWNILTLINTGTVDLVVAAGASNGLRLPNGGTNPTYTVPAGSRLPLESVAGFAVDSTHKVLTITPTAGGSLNITISGS